jgi:hypothetical protein
MKTSMSTVSLLLAGLFASAPALAQGESDATAAPVQSESNPRPAVAPGETSTTPTLARSQSNPTPAVSHTLASVPVVPTGFAVQVGGGVTAFSRQATRDTFGTGGYWDARAIFGTRSFFGAELAYIGSARDAGAAGLMGNAKLLGDGAELAVRANLPIERDDILVEPFVFGGAGWTYFQVVNEDSNTSSVKEHVNALTIPFGAGVSAAYDHFTVDARFTYRPVFDDKLVPQTGGGRDHEDLQNWSAGLTLGYEL